jgi:hypothetical protein
MNKFWPLSIQKILQARVYEEYLSWHPVEDRGIYWSSNRFEPDSDQRIQKSRMNPVNLSRSMIGIVFIRSVINLAEREL